MTDTIDIQGPDDTSTPQAAEPQSESTKPAPAVSDDVAPPVAALIASIRAAVVAGASAEARADGATACRSILTVLEAKPGQPLATPPQPAGPASERGTAYGAIATLLKQPGLLGRLAEMPREQLVDVFKQVTGAMTPKTSNPATAGPRFHLIELPARGNR